MRTESYNPSPLEVELAQAIERLQPEINEMLTSNTITSVKASIDLDNPTLLVKTQDEDGDLHEVVIKVIQRPDNF